MHELAVRVKGVRDEAIEVRSFELVREDGGRLPAFTAGSHIDVHLAPGLVRQYSLCNRPDETESYVIAVMTPGTATTTHYFWAFARNFRLDELAVTEFLRENVGRTFDEDKDMLEAQQYNLGSETEPVFQVAVKADAGPTQARRLLASMIEAESRGSQ